MNQDCNKEAVKYSILKEYFEGDLSEERKQQIASWFENPEFGFKLEACLKKLWDETDPGKVEPPAGTDIILDRIHHKINIIHSDEAHPGAPIQKKPSITFNTALKYISRVAAVILLPLVVYLGWEVIDQGIFLRSQTEVVYNEIICPLGARSRFDLPDGTTGWLNNGSSLKYPLKFMENSREVELRGEAYFDVSHHKDRPFVINTNGLTVKVLGTRLNVHAYPDEQYQTFTLEDGTIELMKDELTIFKMKPGQHAVYAMENGDQLVLESGNMKGKTIVIGEKEENKNPGDMRSGTSVSNQTLNGMINIEFKETSQYTDWINGKLVLRNDPMPIMLKRIERWYNVRFNITDERITQFRYWATFEEENLDQVLRMISLTGPISFEKRPRELKDDGSFDPQEIDIIMKQ